MPAETTKRPVRDVNAMLEALDDAGDTIIKDITSLPHKHAYELAVDALVQLVNEITATVKLSNSIVLGVAGREARTSLERQAAIEHAKVADLPPRAMRDIVAKHRALKWKPN